jgi:hypothetical protein
LALDISLKRDYETILFLVAALMLVGCNKHQATTAANTAGKSYNTFYRDNAIKNWQSKVSDTERCAQFKARFKAAGERHESVPIGRGQARLIPTLEDKGFDALV